MLRLTLQQPSSMYRQQRANHKHWPVVWDQSVGNGGQRIQQHNRIKQHVLRFSYRPTCPTKFRHLLLVDICQLAKCFLPNGGVTIQYRHLSLRFFDPNDAKEKVKQISTKNQTSPYNDRQREQTELLFVDMYEKAEFTDYVDFNGYLRNLYLYDPQRPTTRTWIELSASRSGGAGGQNEQGKHESHVVEILLRSNIATLEQKEICKKLASRITTDGDLLLSSQEIARKCKQRSCVACWMILSRKLSLKPKARQAQ